MDRKVVFLGIDAGNRYLIEGWAREGALPNLRGLLERGLRGNTMSLPGLYTGATWPAFQTGVNPARNGVYSWMQLQPGSYEPFRCLTGEALKFPPFWVHLSDAGRRVAVLDMPLGGLTENINGIQLVEWGTHDAQYGFISWPPNLASEIEARFGRHPLHGICNGDRDTSGFVELRDQLVGGIGIKTRFTLDLLRRGGWNFFGQVYGESHCVGHQCWHLHDPTHPRHDPKQAAVVGDPIRDVYIAIDAAIGEVLRALDRDTTLVVLASHGMGYKYGPQFLLERILLALGVAAPAPAPAVEPKPSPRVRDRFDPLLTRAWQATPENLRQLLQPIRKPLREWMMPERPPRPPLVDPARSHCFVVENNHAHGGVRINLAGREPNGMIHRGAELDRFCERLSSDLSEIVDLDSGRRVVSRVLRTDDLYRGEHRDLLPDLLVEWSSYAPISKIRLGSDKIGEIAGEYRFCRTGDHFPGGMFVAAGPGIERGTVERTVSIMDFAPTFCALLDVPPADFDGQCIRELVAPIAASV